MSPREEQAKRIEDLCGLNPKAIGVGGRIDRAASPYWRTREYTGAVENSYREMPVIHRADEI